MTQSTPQPIQTFAAQSANATASGFAASMLSVRNVALSLLVDRALSA
ncbi:hypothetical protein [Paraburkholderia sp. BCC1884]|nr:hypothetical protein [Paraburkholderia sp. BCC1884]